MAVNDVLPLKAAWRDAMPKFSLSRGDYLSLTLSFREIMQFGNRKLELLGYIFVADIVDLSSVWRM